MPNADFALTTRRAALFGAAGLAASLGGAYALWPATPYSIDPRDPAIRLSDVEERVRRHYGMPQISAADLAARLGREPVALFDVRSLEEYVVGHIPGAIHVDPATDAADFLAEHGPRAAGAVVVFYCSVGVRSSRLMRRLGEALSPRLPILSANLTGGLFRWHAQGRPVVAGMEPAAAIHPFDAGWESLLARTLGR